MDGIKNIDNCNYLIVLRNPIERIISGFSWRKKLVVVDEHPEQFMRFSGEREILNRYPSLEHLAEALYFPKTGALNQNAARDFESIHHLRERIYFYLNPLLPFLRPDNTFGVIVQERMSKDVKKILDVDLTLNVKKNPDKLDSSRLMSPTAILNLRKYLAEDFKCITELWCLGYLDDEGYRLLMNAV